MVADSSSIKKRIELLTEFHRRLTRYSRAGEPEERSQTRTYLNKNVVAVRSAVLEAGALKVITIAPPAAIGGLIHRNIDPFENLLGDFYGRSLVSEALDCIEQAIGVYEHLLQDTGLIRLSPRQAIDIEAAIDRALRPSFRAGPPRSERDVQDAVELILQTLGIDYHRDQQVASVGAKAFKPDFVVPEDDLAIEVKFAREGRSLAVLQEELSADFAAYKTKWQQLLVVVYDCGLIDDPHSFRSANTTLFGVSMIVVKH